MRLRGAVAQIVQRVAARPVDAGEPEDLHRLAARARRTRARRAPPRRGGASARSTGAARRSRRPMRRPGRRRRRPSRDSRSSGAAARAASSSREARAARDRPRRRAESRRACVGLGEFARDAAPIVGDDERARCPAPEGARALSRLRTVPATRVEARAKPATARARIAEAEAEQPHSRRPDRRAGPAHSARTSPDRSRAACSWRQRREGSGGSSRASAHTAMRRAPGAKRRRAGARPRRRARGSPELPMATRTLRTKRSRPVRLIGEPEKSARKAASSSAREVGERRRRDPRRPAASPRGRPAANLFQGQTARQSSQPIDAVADGGAEVARDVALVLDRQIGDAAARIEQVGRGKRVSSGRCRGSARQEPQWSVSGASGGSSARR